MAKKYEHSASDMVDITPDAPPTSNQEQAYEQRVNNALGTIDSSVGPLDQATGNPRFPGWVRMSIQEKIAAVIRTTEADPGFRTVVDDNQISRFEKDVRDAYEEKHRRDN